MSNIYNDFIYSASATAFAEIVTLPICTLKTNYQNSNSTSIINSAKTMFKENGLRIFYKASLPAIGSQIVSTSSKYVFYRYLEDQQFKYSNKVLNGLISGISSSLITHPLDSIKIHRQMNTPFTPELKKHGLKIFYRGYSKTFSKVLVGSSIFLPLYDTFEDHFKSKKYSNYSVLASLFSGFISTIVMHPIDYLKTRHIYGLPLYQGLNPLSYYKGLTLNLMRIVPHFVILMTTINYLKNHKIEKISN